uniref:Uncharacterized protein n=1 Tax=Anguilla anguilla TaxID=7936 RepID=A0A0E9S9I7_ANGAN
MLHLNGKHVVTEFCSSMLSKYGPHFH